MGTYDNVIFKARSTSTNSDIQNFRPYNSAYNLHLFTFYVYSLEIKTGRKYVHTQKQAQNCAMYRINLLGGLRKRFQYRT